MGQISATVSLALSLSCLLFLPVPVPGSPTPRSCCKWRGMLGYIPSCCLGKEGRCGTVISERDSFMEVNTPQSNSGFKSSMSLEDVGAVKTLVAITRDGPQLGIKDPITKLCSEKYQPKGQGSKSQSWSDCRRWV